MSQLQGFSSLCHWFLPCDSSGYIQWGSRKPNSPKFLYLWPVWSYHRRERNRDGVKEIIDSLTSYCVLCCHCITFKLWNLILKQVCLGNSGIVLPESRLIIFCIVLVLKRCDYTSRNVLSRYRKERTQVNFILDWTLNSPTPNICIVESKKF